MTIPSSKESAGMSRPIYCATARRVGQLRRTIVVPKLAIPAVGWLTHGHDAEGNAFGVMQMDAVDK
jgi:predicted enzyme related to lactoylglutathione lyase